MVVAAVMLLSHFEQGNKGLTKLCKEFSIRGAFTLMIETSADWGDFRFDQIKVQNGQNDDEARLPYSRI